MRAHIVLYHFPFFSKNRLNPCLTFSLVCTYQILMSNMCYLFGPEFYDNPSVLYIPSVRVCECATVLINALDTTNKHPLLFKLLYLSWCL